MDYIETIKKRIGGLPESLRAFVLSENWKKEAEKIGQRFNLDEEKYATLENEIFLVLLCFEPRKDFKENIKNGLGIDTGIIGWIAEEVEKNIFSKISNELTEIEKKIDKKDLPSSSIGQSFEDLILNQARGMQPARNALASEAGGPASPPENLPIENMAEQKRSDVNVPNYSGSDPYREPLE